jgi:OOP family OmpA-OmpF porin
MKKLALAAAMALALGGMAKADIVDWVALYGGVTLDPDLNFDGSSYSMRTGYNVGGTLGWNFTHDISGGIDVMYTDSKYDCCSPNGLQSLSVMATGYWNFDIGSKVHPFIGAGLGLVQVTYHTPAPGFSGSDTVFGYQGTVGVTYPLDTNLNLLLAYKYQGADTAKINAPSDADNDPAEYKSNNISIGLVFNIR